MSELPKPMLHVSVFGIDWNGTDPEIRIGGPYSTDQVPNYVLNMGGVSVVCTERTARRLSDALIAALPQTPDPVADHLQAPSW